MRTLIIGFLLFLVSFSYAQDSLQVEEKKEKKFRILPLPAVAVSPTTGLMLGIAPGAYWMLGDPSNTSPSSALGTVIFTQKSNC